MCATIHIGPGHVRAWGQSSRSDIMVLDSGAAALVKAYPSIWSPTGSRGWGGRSIRPRGILEPYMPQALVQTAGSQYLIGLLRMLTNLAHRVNVQPRLSQSIHGKHPLNYIRYLICIKMVCIRRLVSSLWRRSEPLACSPPQPIPSCSGSHHRWWHKNDH